MDRVECGNCGLVLTADGACRRCGSMEQMRLQNLRDYLEINLLETFSMTFVAPIQIWTYLPAAIQSHLRTMAESQKDREIKGLCLVSVVSTAALVEGLVTDYIERELESLLNKATDREPFQKLLNGLEEKGWGRKETLAQRELGWSNCCSNCAIKWVMGGRISWRIVAD
jgi:hypothetical protein